MKDLSWNKKPPSTVRSLKDAIKDAERLRGDLRLIVHVRVSDWDKVILADEIYRLRDVLAGRRKNV